jgi:hypothetical protein
MTSLPFQLAGTSMRSPSRLGCDCCRASWSDQRRTVVDLRGSPWTFDRLMQLESADLSQGSDLTELGEPAVSQQREDLLRHRRKCVPEGCGGGVRHHLRAAPCDLAPLRERHGRMFEVIEFIHHGEGGGGHAGVLRRHALDGGTDDVFEGREEVLRIGALDTHDVRRRPRRGFEESEHEVRLEHRATQHRRPAVRRIEGYPHRDQLSGEGSDTFVVPADRDDELGAEPQREPSERVGPRRPGKRAGECLGADDDRQPGRGVAIQVRHQIDERLGFCHEPAHADRTVGELGVAWTRARLRVDEVPTEAERRLDGRRRGLGRSDMEHDTS